MIRSKTLVLKLFRLNGGDNMFFAELERTEKAMFDALQTKNIKGMRCFLCQTEKAWITPKGCLKRQKGKQLVNSGVKLEMELSVKCEDCPIGKKVFEILEGGKL